MRSVTRFPPLLWWRKATCGTEMSEAAGSRRLMSGVRDPLCANTSGVGEMLLDAHAAWCAPTYHRLAEARPMMADSEWRERSVSDFR